MTGLPSNLPDKESNVGGIASPLIKVLASLADRLKEQTFIFGLAMGILVILAFLVSLKLKYFVPLYVVVGAIVLITILALGAQGLRDKPQESGDGGQGESGKGPTVETGQVPIQLPSWPEVPMGRDEYMLLRRWLDKLTDNEYNDLVNAMTNISERTSLSDRASMINRGTFLGDMQVYGRLGEIKTFLLENYPARFNGLA